MLHYIFLILSLSQYYAIEIWGFTVKEEIERTEVQYLKYILHLPNNAINSAVRVELSSIYFGKKTKSIGVE